MKSVIGSIFFMSVLLSIPRSGVSQQQNAYKVPDSYNFDYEVAQQSNSANKNSGGVKTITYYYSQSGDYTAMKTDNKNNTLIIFTKDGTTVIVDDQKKTITLFRMQNMIGDMSKMAAAQYNKNNPSATPPAVKHDSSNFKFSKTGSTKQISGYTAEEYSFSDNKGEKGSVWYAKVDFNTSLFFMMGAGAAPSGSTMNKYGTNAQSYPQLNDPHLLVVEAENNAHPGEGLTTQSISKKSLVIATNGYHINNLSNMMGQ
jgi:hypothetical protein